MLESFIEKMFSQIAVLYTSIPMLRKRTLFTNKPIYFHEFCSLLSSVFFSHVSPSPSVCHYFLCFSLISRRAGTHSAGFILWYALTCSLNMDGSQLFPGAYTCLSSTESVLEPMMNLRLKIFSQNIFLYTLRCGPVRETQCISSV